MLPRRRSDLVTRDIDGEIVILDGSAGRIHQLNATASYVWNECDGSRSAEDIAARVAAAFEEVPSTIVDDVLRILADFQHLGLLQQGSEV